MLLGIAFLAFVSLGLPDGVLGVAWPSVRRAFELPLSELGVFLGAAMVGYLVSSFSSGAIVERIGVGRLLLWSSAMMVVNSLGYALAPSWPVMVASAVLAGLGAGAIDAGINAYAAVSFSPRVVSWLHACYGVGAMLGPLLLTAVLAGGLGWRWGYGLIAVGLAGMTACFALTVKRWQRPGVGAGHVTSDSPEPPDGVFQTLKRPPVWMSIALFFIYTGLEVTAGQWTYSLFTEARGIDPTVAGAWAGIYWGSLSLGRLLAGALASRVPVKTLLRVSMSAAPVGALIIWSDPARLSGLLGLFVVGFSLAPIYPLMISETPRRVGTAASHAIGFQVGAAYLGTAALPGAAGLLARWQGLETIGPFLVATAIALLVLHEIALRQAHRAGAAQRLSRELAYHAVVRR